MAAVDNDLVERALLAASDLSGTQIQRLVAEARAEAETEVKAVLKSAIKAALLQKALVYIGSAEAAPDVAALARLSPKTACYVYCITAADQSLPRDVQPIDAQFPIRSIGHDALQAIVSDVLHDEFGQAALDKNVTDPQWVERTVRAHDAVVKTALLAGPIIPLRFCVVLRDDDAVRQVLEAHQLRLADALASMKGTTEWGVKVAWRAPSEGESVSGRDYLLQKQARLQGTDKRAAFERAQELHERLSAIARQSVLLPTQRHGSENGQTLLLNGAYLVAETVQRQFHKAAAAFSDKWAPDGLTCEVTGPWPPYNFVNLDLSLQPA